MATQSEAHVFCEARFMIAESTFRISYEMDKWGKTLLFVRLTQKNPGQESQEKVWTFVTDVIDPRRLEFLRRDFQNYMSEVQSRRRFDRLVREIVTMRDRAISQGRLPPSVRPTFSYSQGRDDPSS